MKNDTVLSHFLSENPFEKIYEDKFKKKYLKSVLHDKEIRTKFDIWTIRVDNHTIIFVVMISIFFHAFFVHWHIHYTFLSTISDIRSIDHCCCLMLVFVCFLNVIGLLISFDFIFSFYFVCR